MWNAEKNEMGRRGGLEGGKKEVGKMKRWVAKFFFLL